MPGDRPASRRDRDGVRREGDGREDERRREPENPDEVQRPRYPNADPVQGRQGGGPEDRRGPQGRVVYVPGRQAVRGYLGNQGRNRPNKRGGRGGPDGNRGPRQDELPPDDYTDGEDLDVISPAELEASRKSMSLTELKLKSAPDLLKVAQQVGLENLARSRKQDIIFAILKAHARNGEDIYGDGVLEILQDGFGFLRSADSSYLAGPDDIYVSPSQIRRFNLRTADSLSGLIRPPKAGECYSALLKVGEINFASTENSRNRLLFENLTPLFPKERLQLERGNGSTEDLTARTIDLMAPIGKGQ